VIDAPLLLAGAATGTGIALVVSGLRPSPPDLSAALARLDTAARADTREAAGWGANGVADPLTGPVGDRPTSGNGGLATRLATGLRRWLSRRSHGRDVGPWPVLRLNRFAADLRLVGESVEDLLLRKAGYALLGLTFPPVLTAVMGVVGLRLPWPVPALASVGFAALLFLVPDLDVRIQARAVRADLRQATCAYLDLVALERASDAGPAEALERAATIGTTDAFARIRDALTHARLAGQQPWQGLSRLGEASGVTELSDVADIMRLSGQDGAAVYATLRARATSLRTALTTQAAAKANAASEHMVIPVAALGLVFLLIVAYPAFARIVFGT